MAPQCAICLSDLRNPVTTPCGHVFCSECLMRATARATDGFHTSCPCCRKRFPIAVPDVRYLPAQFRPFVLDPIRSIYFATDDPHDRSDIIQRNESLERENELLRARVQELEADGASSHPGNEEEEGSDPQEIDTPVFLDHPDPDLVLSEVTSNSLVPLYVATNSAYPRSAPLFRPETQLIPPPHPTHTGPARSFAPASVMGLNRPTSGQTISGTFTFSRSETRSNYSTALARPTGPVGPTSSNMGNVLVPGPRTFIFNFPESHHSTPSIPAPRWGAGPSSTVRPTSSGNTGNLSFSHPGAQWTVPSNSAFNFPNQSASNSVLNATGPRYLFSRRESHPRMATAATLGLGSSATNSTADDVPNSSSTSGSESRRPSSS
ncbi:uncharacterized protein EV420DRAFT_654837 [Desarmillaria tabescens]|uniref:RING-type domain-containing protein n=1 Tax=Armillaria tabescens TaxID=1929756 RepID=A0AA39NJT0_ARMTA|nr:uncharacterized protein EV420DRAFT_654837 [Desarmillaria tabescens]KAK0466926.1 hypothetical protein EV420DRAFT_654837 [Desarmillaria tabescens]